MTQTICVAEDEAPLTTHYTPSILTVGVPMSRFKPVNVKLSPPKTLPVFGETDWTTGVESLLY